MPHAKLEEAINDHAEDLDRIDGLEGTIDELAAEKADLEAEIDDLEQRAEEVTAVLSRAEVDEDPFRAGEQLGWYDGKQEFAIRVPCAHCGKQNTVHPGSDLHRAIADFVVRNGWHHRTCPGQPSNQLVNSPEI